MRPRESNSRPAARARAPVQLPEAPSRPNHGRPARARSRRSEVAQYFLFGVAIAWFITEPFVGLALAVAPFVFGCERAKRCCGGIGIVEVHDAREAV